MMTFRAATFLIVSVLSLSVAWAAPETRQLQTRAPGTPPAGTQLPQIPQTTAPIIKHLGVFGPVPGGKETPGLVQLIAPSRDRLGTSIYLSSSRPDLASVPTGVLVPFNTSDVGFKVTTFAVVDPTSVTIAACSKPCGQAGAETKTATVIVRPPVLSSLACTPQQVPVGTAATCTVWLDGTAKANTPVLTSSPEYGNQLFPYIMVYAGEVKGSRQLHGVNSGPQPRPVTVNAKYGGVSRSTNLTVGPAYLKAVSGSSGFAGGNNPHRPYVVLHVELHAPAPSGGLPYTVNLPALGFRKDDRIPASTLSEDTMLILPPVAADTPVQATVTTSFQGANDVKATAVTVKAARLAQLWAFWKCKRSGDIIRSPYGMVDCEYLGGAGYTPDPYYGFKTVELPNVPVGGVTVKVEAWLQGHAAVGGASVALSYSSSLVTGPPKVTIPANNTAEEFRVTVYPCPQAECPGWIRATYLGQTLELPLKVRSQ